MILKALKVLPFLAGTFNAPVLDTPKKAANDEPIATNDFYNEMDQYYTQSAVTGPYTWTSPDNYVWENYTYVGYNEYATTQAEYSFRTITQSFWDVNNARTQGRYMSTWLGGNNIAYTPKTLSMIKIENINGIIKDNIYLELQNTTGWNISKNFKRETYIYISYGDLQSIFNKTYTSSTLVYDTWNQLIQNATVTKLVESTSNGNLASQIMIESELLDYQMSSSKPIYIFAVTNMYSNTENDYAYRSTTPRIVMQPQQGGDYYIEEMIYATIVTQEVIDIPDMMFTVLTLPFSFMSQAFNLTLFPGTQYAVNVSNLLLAIIAILVFALIMKIILGFIK